MPSAAVIHQHQRLATQRSNHHVHPAIVIQIAEGSTAAGYRRCDSGVGALEAPIVIESQQRWFFVMQHVIDRFHVVQHVALRDEQVLPAVVIEIFEAYALA